MLANLFININIILILGFIFGQLYFFKSNKPKIIAIFSIIISLFLFFYLLLIILLSVQSIILHKFFNLILLPFILTPFVIGKIANYKQIDFYTYLQNLFFVLSLILAIFLYK